MKFALFALVAAAAAVNVQDVPARYSADSDDIFMRSVFNNYASEGDNGVFTTSEAQAKALATEVLGTHKGIKGAALDAYLGSYWGKAWGHFDVNRTGAINSNRAAELMRFLMSDQYIQFN